LPYSDNVAGPHHERGNVGFPAVDGEVPVPDQLPGLRSRIGKPHPVDNVVQPALQELQQIVTSHTTLADRFAIELAKLRFENAVVPARLLLFAQLHAVLRGPAGPPLTMLSGGIILRWGLFHDWTLPFIPTR